MRITIGADFVPTEKNNEFFCKGDLKRMFGKELLSHLDSSDFLIFNLEVPLSTEGKTILKCGPSLSAEKKCIKLYKNLKVNLLTLANNHILDQGEDGLKETIETLKNNGIDYIGVGKGIFEAKKSKIYNLDGKKIGVYACCEHEFSIAKNGRWGANPFDYISSFEDIANLKKKCDYAIVLYHGGKEFYRYPSPNLQRICRKFVREGADLVVCQHSHCIGTMEDYEQGKIIYGQGNFLFDHGDDEFWNSSLLINIEIFNNKEIEISYTPIVKDNQFVRKANEQESKEIIDSFKAKSEKIKEAGFINHEYKKFAEERLNLYFRSIYKNDGFFFRIINKISKGRFNDYRYKRIYTPKKCAYILNMIECEAHNELFIAGLKEKINNYIQQK